MFHSDRSGRYQVSTIAADDGGLMSARLPDGQQRADIALAKLTGNAP